MRINLKDGIKLILLLVLLVVTMSTSKKVIMALIVVLFLELWYLSVVIPYKKTAYYSQTHKAYIKIRSDKGSFGEYLTYQELRQFEKNGAKFLFNCYIPKENGETTEIDLIMLYSSGIYVFESKNYSGWIFGNEKQRSWTQTLPNGRTSQKEHFLNPIMQNKLHVENLKRMLGQEYPVHSIVVFSNRCTLKNVEVTSKDVYVDYRDQISGIVNEIDSNCSVMLGEEKIAEVYSVLYPYTQVTEDVKVQHIKDIEESIEMQEPEADQTKIEPAQNICPRCGGNLILRTAKKGDNTGRQFYGCSNYPKCRYIRNI